MDWMDKFFRKTAMANTRIEFKFEPEKAIEVILYITHNISDPTYHSINKILYFADKTSLENFGRFICGDTYYAMKHGPVPSNTYDLMKEAPPNGEYGFTVENDRKVIPLRAPDLEKLSESDIECLEQVIKLYGQTPYWKKTQDSHDDAWKKAWDARGDKQSNLMPVESIVELLEDDEDLLEHLLRSHDE
jgi:uncharacterized phage-associated protein